MANVDLVGSLAFQQANQSDVTYATCPPCLDTPKITVQEVLRRCQQRYLEKIHESSTSNSEKEVEPKLKTNRRRSRRSRKPKLGPIQTLRTIVLD